MTYLLLNSSVTHALTNMKTIKSTTFPVLHDVTCYVHVRRNRVIDPHILTSVLDGGELSATAPTALPLLRGTVVPTVQETAWAPEPA